MAYQSVTPLARIGAGEPVLLLHPFATSHHVWSRVAETLAAGGRDVLAPTMLGHWGGPKPGPDGMRITALADHIERVMDEAGWPTAHIVGNSLGGWIAFELERRGRARSVVAIAPAGGWRHWSWREIALGLRFLAALPMLLLAGLLRLSVDRSALGAIVRDPAAVPDDLRRSTFLAMTHCPGYLGLIRAALRDGGITGLDAVRAPTLLALCARDTFIPPHRYGSMFVEELPPHAERILLPRVGHVPQLENPGLVAETISGFIAKQDLAQPSARKPSTS